MKREMGIIIAALFLITLVRADTNVNVGVSTPGNINFYGFLEADGNISVIIDGVGFPQYVDESILHYALNNRRPNIYLGDAIATEDKINYLLGEDGTQTENCPTCMRSAELLNYYVGLRAGQVTYPLYLHVLAIERSIERNKSLEWAQLSVATEFDAYEVFGLIKPDIMRGYLVIAIPERNETLENLKAAEAQAELKRQERLNKKKELDIIKFNTLCDTTKIQRYCEIAKNIGGNQK